MHKTFLSSLYSYDALPNATKHVKALRSFPTVLWETIFPELVREILKDIGRHNFYIIHGLVYCLLLVIGRPVSFSLHCEDLPLI